MPYKTISTIPFFLRLGVQVFLDHDPSQPLCLTEDTLTSHSAATLSALPFPRARLHEGFLDVVDAFDPSMDAGVAVDDTGLASRGCDDVVLTYWAEGGVGRGGEGIDRQQRGCRNGCGVG